jgi:hypothetical protein
MIYTFIARACTDLPVSALLSGNGGVDLGLLFLAGR